jgi:hypothetical protein
MQKLKNVVPLLIQNFKERKNLIVHTFEEIIPFLRYRLCNCPKGQNIAGRVNFKGWGQDPLDTPTLNRMPLWLDPLVYMHNISQKCN